jgi:hypothetical protein
MTQSLHSPSDIRIQNLILLGVSSIYLPIIPGFAETQPILLFLIGGWLFATGRVRLNYHLIMMVFFSAMSFLVLAHNGFDMEAVQELSKFILMLCLAFIISGNLGFGSKLFYIAFVLVHVFFAFIVSLGGNDWLSMIFPRYTSLEGGRGLSFFSSEPSYAATYIFFVALVYTLGLNKGVFYSRLIQWALFSLLLSTLSLLGFILFFSLVLVDISFSRVRKKILVITFGLLSGIMLFSTVDRFSMELLPLILSIYNGEAIIDLVLNYPSASTRVVLNSIAFFDGIERIIMFPSQSFNSALPSMLNKYGIGEVLYSHEVISPIYQSGVNLKPQALYPYLFYTFGFVSLLFVWQPLVVLYKVFLTKRVLFLFACCMWFILFFMYQSQYINPIQIFIFMIVRIFLYKRAPDEVRAL